MDSDERVIISVLLADAEELVRRGFRLTLEEEADIRVVAETRNGAETLRLTSRYRPDVVLFEINMPNADWFDVIQEIVAQHAGERARIIVLTSSRSDRNLFLSLRAGASGFLLKNVTRAELVYAVRAVAEGYAAICPAMTRRLLDNFRILPQADLEPLDESLSILSAREIEVLINLAAGKSNQQIANELYLTTATVKSHVSNILSKLDLKSRVQAALFAHQVGLARPPAP